MIDIPGYKASLSAITFLLTLLLGLPAFEVAQAQEEPAPEAECPEHGLDPAELKQRLRHYSGLAAFNRWKLAAVKPASCARDGNVSVELVLAPPKGWSHFRIPYRTTTRIEFDAVSKTPLSIPNREFKKLVAGVHRLIVKAEAHEDVRSFIERFPPGESLISPTGGTNGLQVTYIAAGNKFPSNRRPQLVFSESAEQGIVGYFLPRMDSLPVRRELLRFIESASENAWHCRPVWIHARFEPGSPAEDESVEDEPGRWLIYSGLQGQGCPARFSKAVDEDLRVHDWVPETAGGDSGGN